MKVGEEITGKIIRIKKSKITQLELSCLKEHLEMKEGKLSKGRLLDVKTRVDKNEFIGMRVNAVIKSIKPTSINAIYYELGNNIYAFSDVFSNIYVP